MTALMDKIQNIEKVKLDNIWCDEDTMEWFWSDETSYWHGPYDSEDAAKDSLDEYVQWLRYQQEVDSSD